MKSFKFFFCLLILIVISIELFFGYWFIENPFYFIPKAITQYVVPTAMLRNRLKVLGLKRFQGIAAAGSVDFALTDPYEDNAFNLFSEGLSSDMVNNMVEYLKSTPVDKAFQLKTGVGVEKFVDATKSLYFEPTLLPLLTTPLGNGMITFSTLFITLTAS